MPDDLLSDFVDYCRRHPGERFWQALRNWSEVYKIVAVLNDGQREDTFYWKARDGWK